MWTEFNITLLVHRDQFLSRSIRSLLLAYDIESWHYFMEPGEGWEAGMEIDQEETVMRLRILHDSPKTRKALRNDLRILQQKGLIRSFYRGAHGRRREEYEPEHALYGENAWRVTYQLWEALSQLSLTLAVHSDRGELELPRSHHWKRTAHLQANQLGLPDVRMNLEQGHRYLQVKKTLLGEKLSKADMRIMDELDRYLYREEVI